VSDRLSHDQIEELLGAFALDAVDGPERDIIEAHLADCPRCRAEVTGHRETAALLAHSGVHAPEGVWTQIAEALDEAPPELDLARIVPLTDKKARAGWSRRSVSLRTTAAAVALAAALTAFLGVQVGRTDARLDRVQNLVQGFLRKEGIRSAAMAAMGDPKAEELELTTPDGKSVEARVVRQPDGTGFLVADRLAPLPANRTYQLWAVRSEAKISLAVLGNNPDVAPFRITGPVLAYAITEEVADGVAATQNPPVVVGRVQPG
jgi:anti-sigma factor RsiW